MPGAELALRLDGLSAFFLVPVSLVTALAAIYAPAYTRACAPTAATAAAFPGPGTTSSPRRCCWSSRRRRPALPVRLGGDVPRLVLPGHEPRRGRGHAAGRLDLPGRHPRRHGLPLVMFLLLGRRPRRLRRFGAPRRPGCSSSWPWSASAPRPASCPLHVWLPEAHPAAPSPRLGRDVRRHDQDRHLRAAARAHRSSARPPPGGAGRSSASASSRACSACCFALAQHDLKRLLAYYSVENIGIIALGIGHGAARPRARPATVAALGFAGACCTSSNHALFKGLLFLGAGAVLTAPGRATSSAWAACSGACRSPARLPRRRRGDRGAAALNGLRERAADLPGRLSRRRDRRAPPAAALAAAASR